MRGARAEGLIGSNVDGDADEESVLDFGVLGVGPRDSAVGRRAQSFGKLWNVSK